MYIYIFKFNFNMIDSPQLNIGGDIFRLTSRANKTYAIDANTSK